MSSTLTLKTKGGVHVRLQVPALVAGADSTLGHVRQLTRSPPGS